MQTNQLPTKTPVESKDNSIGEIILNFELLLGCAPLFLALCNSDVLCLNLVSCKQIDQTGATICVFAAQVANLCESYVGAALQGRQGYEWVLLFLHFLCVLCESTLTGLLGSMYNLYTQFLLASSPSLNNICCIIMGLNLFSVHYLMTRRKINCTHM